MGPKLLVIPIYTFLQCYFSDMMLAPFNDDTINLVL